MMCLGAHSVPQQRFDAEAAELRIFTSFASDFRARHAGGLVTRGLEYQGGTESAHASSRPLRTPGRPGLETVLDAMASDFRRWSKERDYRKCDVLGISADGRYAELIEVTTEPNAASAIRQVRDKLDQLRRTVNATLNRPVDWQPSRWRPARDLFCPLASTSDQIRYACYEPTRRAQAPEGVILYERHALSRRLAVNPLPRDVQDAIRDSAQKSAPGRDTAEAWAVQLANSTPAVAQALRVLAAAGAVAAAVAAVALLIDPVPGDELAAFSAAAALLRVARGSQGASR